MRQLQRVSQEADTIDAKKLHARTRAPPGRLEICNSQHTTTPIATCKQRAQAIGGGHCYALLARAHSRVYCADHFTEAKTKSYIALFLNRSSRVCVCMCIYMLTRWGGDGWCGVAMCAGILERSHRCLRVAQCVCVCVVGLGVCANCCEHVATIGVGFVCIVVCFISRTHGTYDCV